MRTVKTETIVENIKEMCIEANYFLSEDMKNALNKSAETEESQIGKKILGQLRENLEIAGKKISSAAEGNFAVSNASASFK